MRLIRSVYQNIRRTPYQAFATLLVMVFVFFLSGLFTFLAFSSQKILSYFEAKPQISAFFDTELSPERVEKIRKKLEKTGKMAGFRYVSKEEAFRIYQQLYKDEPLLLEMVSPDILPSSIEVSAYNPKELKSLAELLKNEEGVQDVRYLKDIVENLIFWTQVVRLVGISLLAILGLVSALVVLIVIGMRIGSKKKEISIMSLLGATRWYIQSPFILEGIFYGFSGAGIAWLIIFSLYLLLKPYLVGFFEGVSLFPLPFSFWLLFLSALLLEGVLIGFLGSVLALRRYLKQG